MGNTNEINKNVLYNNIPVIFNSDNELLIQKTEDAIIFVEGEEEILEKENKESTFIKDINYSEIKKLDNETENEKDILNLIVKSNNYDIKNSCYSIRNKFVKKNDSPKKINIEKENKLKEYNEYKYFRIKNDNQANFLDLSLVLDDSEYLIYQNSLLKNSSTINRNLALKIFKVDKKMKFEKNYKDPIYKINDFKTNSKNSELIEIDTIKNYNILSNNLDLKNIELYDNYNCYLGSSIISIINYCNMFNINIFNKIILFEKDLKLFKVIIYFNGCKRIINIDNKFWINKNIYNGLSIIDINSFWPIIIEKTLLKLLNANNYNYRIESNLVTYLLIGWIPDTILLKNLNNYDEIFENFKTNLEEGNIIINLSNSKLKFDDSISIISLKIENNNKVAYFTMKYIKKFNKFIENKNEININQTKYSNFTFKLEWKFLLSYYEKIKLNFNPKIYDFNKYIISNILKENIIKNDLYYMPQYIIKFEKRNEISQVRIFIEYFYNEFPCKEKFDIIYELYNYKNDRIFYSNKYIRKFSSNENFLSDHFNLNVNNSFDYFLILVKFVFKNTPLYEKYNFKINIFSLIPFELSLIPFKKKISNEKLKRKIKDRGNMINTPFFFNNIFYKLTILKKSFVSINCEVKDDYKILIYLFSFDSKDQKIYELNYEKIILNNEFPKIISNVCIVEKNLKEGDYFLVFYCNKNLGSYLNFEINIFEEKLYFENDNSDAENINKNEIYKISKIKNDFKYYFPNNFKLNNKWTYLNNIGIQKLKVKSYQKFMQNLGYLINNSHGKILIKLSSQTYINNYNNFDPPALNICLMEYSDNFEFNIILEDDLYIKSSWGFISKEIEIQKNKKYILFCLNYHIDSYDEFNLEIYSENKLNIENSANLFNDYKFCNEYINEWNFYTAGGYFLNQTFKENPSINFELKNQSDIFIILESEKDYPITVYLINSSLELKLINQSLISKSIFNQIFLPKLNSLFTNLKPGKYILVPSTLQPNQKGKFKVRIFSKAKLFDFNPDKIDFNQNKYFKWNSYFIINDYNNLEKIKKRYLNKDFLTFKVIDYVYIKIEITSKEGLFGLYKYDNNSIQFLSNSNLFINKNLLQDFYQLFPDNYYFVVPFSDKENVEFEIKFTNIGKLNILNYDNN